MVIVAGVETTSGNPVEASRRQEAQEKERKEMEEKANSLAEKRGQVSESPRSHKLTGGLFRTWDSQSVSKCKPYT